MDRHGGDEPKAAAEPFDSAAWTEEWQRPAWGNYAANLAFLDATGLLRPGLAILEIGCGRGPMMLVLRARGLEPVGLHHDAALPATWDHGGRACAGRAERLPFPDSRFDLVPSFDLLEHVPDTDRHLEEVRRVLRRRLERHGFLARVHRVPVVNDWFRAEVRRLFGPLGLAALRVVDPDRLPAALRPNLYVEARLPGGDGGHPLSGSAGRWS